MADVTNTTAQELQGVAEAQKVFALSQNERRVLALLQRQGAMPAVEIAKELELSAQSGSVLTRNLEADGLIVRDDPVRGKVGKPQTPFRLHGAGAFSVGMRIGRRSSEMVLLDFTGDVLAHERIGYAYPTPKGIVDFSQSALARLTDQLDGSRRHRIVGIGIGAPFELWKWLDNTSAPKEDMLAWRGFDLARAFAAFTDLHVVTANDASMACQGEAMFGAAVDLTDFGYFYIGSFIGGGVFLDGRLYTGSTGNAAAFGSLPVRLRDGSWGQLLSHASLIQLENRLEARCPGQSQALLRAPEWVGFDDLVDAWLAETSEYLAHGALMVAAAFDVPAIVLDCGTPKSIRETLIKRVRMTMRDADHRGIRVPELVQGALGSRASALGAGYQPIIAGLLT